MIEQLLKVNSHLEKIVKNSKEHCHLCKIMNVTQDPFRLKSFESDIYEWKGTSIELVPESLKKMGRIKLCEDCFEDSGYDKIAEKDDIEISSVYTDLEIEQLEKNRGLYMKCYDPETKYSGCRISPERMS